MKKKRKKNSPDSHNKDQYRNDDLQELVGHQLGIPERLVSPFAAESQVCAATVVITVRTSEPEAGVLFLGERAVMACKRKGSLSSSSTLCLTV